MPYRSKYNVIKDIQPLTRISSKLILMLLSIFMLLRLIEDGSVIGELLTMDIQEFCLRYKGPYFKYEYPVLYNFILVWDTLGLVFLYSLPYLLLFLILRLFK